MKDKPSNEMAIEISEESPERNLLAAIVTRAIDDYLLYRDTISPSYDVKKDGLLASEWLGITTESYGFEQTEITFEFCCSHLTLDANVIRDRLNAGKIAAIRNQHVTKNIMHGKSRQAV